MRRKSNCKLVSETGIVAGDYNAVKLQDRCTTSPELQTVSSIFDKIGRPSHFPAVKNLTVSKAGLAWEGLYQYMLINGVELNVCSPNISAYELYRFATEELFYFDIEDSVSPDEIYSFIYDDFYPDHKYDNSRAAVDDCMCCIFSERSYEWMHFFRGEDLTLNHHKGLSKEDFKIRVEAFQSRYSTFSKLNIRALKVSLNDNWCSVSGSYSVQARTADAEITLEGDWLVQFNFDANLRLWEIVCVKIKNLSL